MNKYLDLEHLRANATRESSTSTSSPESHVGKQALTDSLPAAAAGAAVQMRSMWSGVPFGPVPDGLSATDAASAANDVTHGAAEHGIRGSSGPLPFFDQIQRSFGGHDISHVRAHTDANAAQGAEAMGAQAYATGDHVAFAGAPDLHTAAHEAAHVIQQRAGVHLKGGVGEVGDRYEQHADAVADRVVRGESAVDLLDQVARPGARAAAPAAIQHKLGGAITGLTADALFNAIKGFGGVKYSERNALLATIKTSETEFTSLDDAVLFLLQGKPGHATAQKAIEQKAKKLAAAAAQKRLADMMKVKYPDAGANGGSKKLYRGDNRTENEIAAAQDSEGNRVGGFFAKNPLSVDDARAQVKAWFKKGGDPKGKHETWIRNPAAAGGDKVATGTDIGCMGYGVRDAMQGASANVYMIDVPNLTEVAELTADVLGEEPVNKVTYATGPKLLLNAPTLADATMIAVRGAGNAAGETTFFTAVPQSAVKLAFEATKWKAGATISADRNENQSNREKSDQGWVDAEMHAQHAETMRLTAEANKA